MTMRDLVADFEANTHTQTGVVKKWTDRGFGFIARDDGNGDLFVHISDVTADVDELLEGQRVRFVVGVSRKTGKPCAQSVELVD